MSLRAKSRHKPPTRMGTCCPTGPVSVHILKERNMFEVFTYGAEPANLTYAANGNVRIWNFAEPH